MWSRHATRLWLACLGVAFGGCASIPKHSYGVEDLHWRGVEQVNEESIEACITTRQRDTVGLRLGVASESCGTPPFDDAAPNLDLFSWPWTEWPVFDEAIFEIDRTRIERWYRARGYYQARVQGVRFVADGEEIAAPTTCTTDDCELEMEISVFEGEPVRVSEVVIDSESPLPEPLREALLKLPDLAIDSVFDEALYEADKTRLQDALTEASFAHASVAGRVEMDRVNRRATVRYTIDPGPACRFGSVQVIGQEDLSTVMIVDVASIDSGDPYRTSVLRDAERAVYALGTFSSVRVEPQLQRQGELVNILITVSPARLSSFRLGVGVMSGVLNAGVSDEVVSVPEWDVHLRAAYRNENFLGGMRRLRIEERPRVIMLRRFPSVPVSGPLLGNALDVTLEQPRFLEARTTLFSAAHSDLGPDPFFGFFRHVLSTRLGVKRDWFGARLHTSIALAHDVYDLLTSNHPDTVSSYRLPFVEQTIRIDLRDDGQRPSRGVYFATSTQEALRLGYADWNYLRATAEVRAYQRLPLRIVFAQRLAIGGLFVFDSNAALDPTSRVLGPQEYRMRGGGANSNRGFSPGTLGVGLSGGKRRWEGSVEVRVPLGADLGVVMFFDVGDVNDTARVRFDHLNAATGLGLRYFTSFAPIRLDFGWRIPHWQVVGSAAQDADTVTLGVLPSAAHLTIGEAF